MAARTAIPDFLRYCATNIGQPLSSAASSTALYKFTNMYTSSGVSSVRQGSEGTSARGRGRGRGYHTAARSQTQSQKPRLTHCELCAYIITPT